MLNFDKTFKGIVLMLLGLSLLGGECAEAGKVRLLWPNAEDAVMYELEIAKMPLRGNKPAEGGQLVYKTTDVFTPGAEVDTEVLNGLSPQRLYYRSRPLNLDKQPVGNFTAPASVAKGLFDRTKPTVTAALHRRTLLPLYPVYSWIPVLGAAHYEVEITDNPPENPDGIEPSQYRVRSYIVDGGFDCYDEHAYTESGRYYWRVRAIDENSKPLGSYSDAQSFVVRAERCRWAVFGDSITHGGGAVSNPPSDERFDYSSYLPFPVKNLGKSGDTSTALAERFEHDVLPFKPSYLLILGGSNSIRGGEKAASVIADLQVIKEKCEKYGITPVFLTLPPVNPERIQRVFHQGTAEGWQEELAAVNAFIKSQPYAIDVYKALADENGILPAKYASDGLHPDMSGKRIMAKTVYSYLRARRLV